MSVDPALKDMTFAAETYDAVNLAAIAAAAAEDDAGASIAASLIAVSGGKVPTSGGAAPSGEATVCKSYQECLDVLRAGKQPDYDGESGRIGFDANGDVSFRQLRRLHLRCGQHGNHERQRDGQQQRELIARSVLRRAGAPPAGRCRASRRAHCLHSPRGSANY